MYSEAQRPTGEEIRHYYDSQTGRKLRDFINGNARVDSAFKTLNEWLPTGCRSILEVGCGIGAVSWRMAQLHPEMQVVGLDVSPVSIRIAQRLFKRPNLVFKEQMLSPGNLDGQFDCVVLMDVYEHIETSQRAELHSAISGVLSKDGRVVLTFPAPRKLSYQRIHQPEEIQPVDENIECREIGQFADDLACEVLCFKTVDVWNSGDYYHAILGRLKFPAPPRAETMFKSPFINRAHRFFLRKIVANIVTPGPLKRKRLRMVRRAFGPNYDPVNPPTFEEST